MIERELDEVLEHCPNLYHMAERGSWPSIRARGLLSTSALLDLYSVRDPARSRIQRAHRPRCIELCKDDMPRAVIRDQIPMSDSGLRRCLPPRLSPGDWYEILNQKVFFWLSENRLHKLTGAKAYRDLEHDVLVVDTRSLVDAHRESIWCCPINSGCTKPVARERDESVFARIEDYPYEYWRTKRKRTERVVELAVDYAVADIRDHIRQVVVKRGTQVVSVLE